MRLLMNFASRCLLYLLFVSCTHGANEFNSRKSNRRPDNACSALQDRCRCRLRNKHEQTMTCSRENRLEHLPMNKVPYAHATEIKCIVIARQENITSIGSGELSRMSNLRDVRIFRCRIQEIAPDAFAGLTYVERLDLHRNNLSEVPTSIHHLRSLKSLNLGGNRITYVTSNAFNANSLLEKLVLSRNALIEMPIVLPKSLIKLSLGGNMLQNVGFLQDFDRLQILNAEGNDLKEFPTGLPSSIKVINLCGNKINKTISLQNLPNLTAISLNDNPNIGNIMFTTFSDTLSRSSTSRLKTFNARNAGIRSIHADSFACLSKLEHLDISNNSIQNYHPRWFTGNRLLRTVRLTGNQWRCDCNVKSNLDEIAIKFTRRRKNKNGSFVHDFSRETCRDGSSCGEFKLKNHNVCPTERIQETTTQVTVEGIADETLTRSNWPKTPGSTPASSTKDITTLLVTSTSTTIQSPTSQRTSSTKPLTAPTTEKKTATTTAVVEEVQWCLEDGRKCHFPFLYGGKKKYECTGYYNWCSPTHDYDEDQQWGACVKC